MTCNLQILRRAHRRLGACRVAGRVGCCHHSVCNQQGGLRCVQWPTFPQVYIGGEFFGGCDILLGVFEGASNRSTCVCGSHRLYGSLYDPLLCITDARTAFTLNAAPTAGRRR
jgi:hypothetical protein